VLTVDMHQWVKKSELNRQVSQGHLDRFERIK
jgi:hypothetical protein